MPPLTQACAPPGCPAGFYVAPGDATACAACPTGCAACTAPLGLCSQCAPGYQLLATTATCQQRARCLLHLSGRRPVRQRSHDRACEPGSAAHFALLHAHGAEWPESVLQGACLLTSVVSGFLHAWHRRLPYPGFASTSHAPSAQSWLMLSLSASDLESLVATAKVTRDACTVQCIRFA